MTPDSPSDPGDRPSSDFGQFGPGRLDLRFLDQATWWVDSAGQPHRIATMNTEYVRNVIALCQANAAHLHIAYVLRLADCYLDARTHWAAHLATRAALASALSLDPDAWLAQTPLLLALHHAMPANRS